MKKCMQLKISKTLCSNPDLNRKILCMKRSWDEVEALINHRDCCKPKEHKKKY